MVETCGFGGPIRPRDDRRLSPHMQRLLLLCSLCWLVEPAILLAAVTGHVLTGDETAIEHAKVERVDGPDVAYTDNKGRFDLPDAVPPLELVVSHPRFVKLRMKIESEDENPLEIVLQAKQQVYEEIAVSANRGEENFSPMSVATSVIQPGESGAPPSTLTQIVSQIPSVSENGQGGIFQTYSIRGISRQRVLTLVSGMRIVSERRAGVSASFVDPFLMSTVDVLRGPSSTYWGSGALGGVVQLFPREFDSWSVEAGYDSQGDERYLSGGWGTEGWSLGLAHRQAEDAETPDGERLHSGFTQTSGTLQKSWSTRRHQYELLAIASAGRDIGKASTDFPERTTTYPEEDHLLLRFGLGSEADWRFEAWIHPNELETEVVELGTSESRLQNEAFDLGLNWQKQVRVSSAVVTRLGVDYFGRRNVTARERTDDQITGEIVEQATLDDGEEDEAGLYGAVEWNWGNAVVLGGGRFSWQRQQNAHQPSTDETAGSAFAGLLVPLGAGFELTANAGTGLRFPSLGERFFSGVTGRGEILGNPTLDAERSLNIDAGLRWYGQKLYLAGYLFHNRIDDYIERIEVEPELLTFVNLVSGTIQGAELEGFYQFNGSWTFSFGGHLLEGRDDDDQPLADVPADRIYLGGRWKQSRWGWEGRWEERADKTDPGSGEKPIPSASLLSMSVRFAWREDLSLVLSGGNLLDEEYFNSADRKVPLAAGRSIGLSLRWTQTP